MKKKYFLKFILLNLLLLSACNKPSTSSPNFMILKDVKYVEKFPESYVLLNKTEPDIDIIGINDFCIYDSMLIFSTKNPDSLWSFFSLPTYNHVGSLLKKGNGPFEFIQPPSVSNKTTLFNQGDELFTNIYDFQKGKVIKVNITKSLKEHRLRATNLKDSLPSFLFNFIVISDSSFFCKKTNNNETQQIRYIIDKGKESTPTILNSLNRASINEGEDINILSTITKYSSKNDMIVEIPIGLNYINLYSLDIPFSRTICIGKELYDISKIQEKKRWERIYSFADLRLYDHFWGVLYINESEMNFQAKSIKFSSILLFDWSGNPLASLKLHQMATSFDIDVKNGTLYTYNFDTEKFYKYDISDILTKLLK